MDDAEFKHKLERTADEFVFTARESSNLANDRTFEFARLLIQIAFASIGLVAIRIVGARPDEIVASRWGLVLLSVSIVAGGTQIFVDRVFFSKNSRAAIQVADKIRLHVNDLESSERTLDMKAAFDKYVASERTSNFIALIIQTTLVLVGSVLILSDILFRF